MASQQITIEKEVALSGALVQLGTVQLETAEVRLLSGYQICQRLSENHRALRIGNVSACEAFPRARSVGFLPAGLPVQLYPLDQPFRVLNCAFEKDFFETTTEIGQEFWEEHFDVLMSIKDRRLEMMMQEIYAELVQPGFAHNLLIESVSNLILVEMARYGRRMEKVNRDGGARQGLTPWQMRRIRERIDASPEISYPSLSDLAQLCGISQSHLMRTFKVSTGWQIHKYIAEERLNAAKLMLADDKLSSKEISARLGFCSPAYFATAFRRMTGLTPSDFRRRASVPEMGNA